MKKYLWGIDVGGTTVKLGLFLSTGEVVDKFEIETKKSRNGEDILPSIAKAIDNYIREHEISKEDILGIGLALPGSVSATGTIHGAVNLGWGTFNVREVMEELTQLPVVSGNDANAAALGEMWQGSARGALDVVMVTLGTGVGGGVILDGNIQCGHKGAAGEIGHIHVEDDEVLACSCGNYGCLEQYASATGLVRMAKKKLLESKEASALRNLKEITAKEVFDQAKVGDSLAMELVETFARYLGKGLACVANVVAPEKIVIGGGVSAAGDIIIELASKYFVCYAFRPVKDVELSLASLGNDAGIYGAARMVLNIERD